MNDKQVVQGLIKTFERQHGRKLRNMIVIDVEELINSISELDNEHDKHRTCSDTPESLRTQG